MPSRFLALNPPTWTRNSNHPLSRNRPDVPIHHDFLPSLNPSCLETRPIFIFRALETRENNDDDDDDDEEEDEDDFLVEKREELVEKRTTL